MMQNAQDGSTKIPTDQLDPNLFFAIDNLKVGEISQPTLFTLPSGEQAYRVVQFISKTEPHRANLKDDYQKIQQAALSSKQNKTMEDWFDKKRASTFIKIFNQAVKFFIIFFGNSLNARCAVSMNNI